MRMKLSEANVILKVIAKGDTIIDLDDLALSLIQKQKEYIKMLGNEIDSLVWIAHTHGWKSKNIRKGEKLRKEMSILDKQISNHIE